MSFARLPEPDRGQVTATYVGMLLKDLTLIFNTIFSELKRTRLRTFAEVETDYTVATGIEVVIGDSTSASFDIELPPAAELIKKTITFKKDDASGNTITLNAFAAELIEGSNTYVLTGTRPSVRLYSTGTYWVAV